MPRVNVVKVARKDQGKCGRCGDGLPKGSPYRYWEFRYGGKRIRCMKPTCNPRPSETTANDKLAELYSIQENLEDLASSLNDETIADDVKSDLESARDRAQEVYDMYQESIDNMEQTFTGGSPVIDEMEEKRDEVESWVSELENAIDQIDNLTDEDNGKVEKTKGDWVTEATDLLQQTAGALTL